MAASLFDGKETREYIKYLYTDKIDLYYEGKFYKERPTIICVVKNEADKLENFFSTL